MNLLFIACALALTACASTPPTDDALREQEAVAKQREAEQLARELEAMPESEKQTADKPESQ